MERECPTCGGSCACLVTKVAAVFPVEELAKFYVQKGKAVVITNVGPENNSVTMIGNLTEEEKWEFMAIHGFYPIVGAR